MSMPPTPPAGFPVYNARFTTSSATTWFSVQQNGYGSNFSANRSIEPIPWAQTYSVVIQRGGLNPNVRRYRALVYTEADFDALAAQVNKPNGFLATPREGLTGANLDEVSRGQRQDYTDPNGLLEVELTFSMLEG